MSGARCSASAQPRTCSPGARAGRAPRRACTRGRSDVPSPCSSPSWTGSRGPSSTWATPRARAGGCSGLRRRPHRPRGAPSAPPRARRGAFPASPRRRRRRAPPGRDSPPERAASAAPSRRSPRLGAEAPRPRTSSIRAADRSLARYLQRLRGSRRAGSRVPTRRVSSPGSGGRRDRARRGTGRRRRTSTRVCSATTRARRRRTSGRGPRRTSRCGSQRRCGACGGSRRG
mmetsp:Transcript_9066/g.38419  ORF Transcript_9066/g.38419 Transcript_9066/m.38419 type:complete len:230 (-) Transcript_9066:64-753(-)